MCGIFGVVDTCGPGVDLDILWSGTQAVRHRGPNDWGFVSILPVSGEAPPVVAWKQMVESSRSWRYRIGLGSRRLSILDLSEAGRQPMNLPRTDLWIVFNGEIYNYKELREELADDCVFETNTDTEVLLAAYGRWGRDCLRRLNGMFAFAIWDGRRKRLFLARDRFGEKPLYYTCVAGRLTFGSELKQFAADTNFSRDPDYSALADFLLFTMQDHDRRTFLSRVCQLRPAHWIEMDAVTGELTEPECYWMPQIADDLDAAQDSEFNDRLEWLLADAIRLRLRSDVRVGLCLSGGIDSTAICAMMSPQVPDASDISAYTISFPGFADDEALLAGRAAARAGVRHRESSFDASDLWDQIHRFVYIQDGPTGGVSNFASWRVFQTARDDGTVVLLNGQGGDELFAGYNKFFFFWFQILLARGEWSRLSREAAAYFRVHALDRWDFRRGTRYFPLAIGKKLAGLWDFSRPELRRHATTTKSWGGGNSLNARLWKDLSQFSLPCLLHWEDRNSMAAGTEARLPFLDHRIAEAVLATSACTKLAHGFSKYSLRRVMSGSLPPEVCWQKKKRGFDTPAESWFKADLAPHMRALLSRKGSPLNELFDTTRLLEQYELSLTGGNTALNQFDWFRLMTTSLWLEQGNSSLRGLSWGPGTASRVDTPLVPVATN
jgi:asparagine synthase (glutamine-hydrolysing)